MLSAPDLRKPGRVELQEFEYIRHGTQCLIANWHVALGKVIASSIGATRTEADFAAHITQTINTDPDAGWIFIVDQLNIHQSESLVRLVAECCGLDIDLGIKGHSGILESMSTRATFLADVTHRIRFVYIPKHTSWLNQIERSRRRSASGVGSLFWYGDFLNELALHHFRIYAIAFLLSSTTLTERWLSPFNGSSRAIRYQPEVASYFCRDALAPLAPFSVICR